VTKGPRVSVRRRAAEECGSARAGQRIPISKIIKISRRRGHRISYRAAVNRSNARRWTVSLDVEDSSTATIGDALKSKLRRDS